MRKIGFLTSVLFLLIACNSGNNNAKTAEESPATDDRIFVSNEQFEKNAMTLVKPQEMDFPKTIEVSGVIDVPPQNKAVITAIMGGYVKSIPFLVGDVVKKGQPLLYIENQDFVRLQQQYLETQQQLEFLKSEYERQKALYQENISSQKNYLKAQSDYNSALAQLSGLRKQLQLVGINTQSLNFNNITSVVSISSPINGNVSEILVEQGAFVSSTSPLIKVIDNEHLHLILTVFEKDAFVLKKGQKVWFTLPEISKEKFSATIQLVSSNIDEKRTVRVNAHIDNEKAMNFISGMFATAQIITETEKAYGLTELATAEIHNGLYGLKLNEKTDKGYYFDQVKIPSERAVNGFVRLAENTDGQYLTGKVFELVK